MIAALSAEKVACFADQGDEEDASRGRTIIKTEHKHKRENAHAAPRYEKVPPRAKNTKQYSQQSLSRAEAAIAKRVRQQTLRSKYYRVVVRDGVCFRTAPDISAVTPDGKGVPFGNIIEARQLTAIDEAAIRLKTENLGRANGEGWVRVQPHGLWLPTHMYGTCILEKIETPCDSPTPQDSGDDSDIAEDAIKRGALTASSHTAKSENNGVRYGGDVVSTHQSGASNGIPTFSPRVSGRAKRARTGGRRPKQPKTAYNFYQLAVRAEISAELKQSLAESGDSEAAGLSQERLNQEVMRLIGRRWRSLDPQERNVYQRMAAEDARRYQNELQLQSPGLSPRSANSNSTQTNSSHYPPKLTLGTNYNNNNNNNNNNNHRAGSGDALKLKHHGQQHQPLQTQTATVAATAAAAAAAASKTSPISSPNNSAIGSVGRHYSINSTSSTGDSDSGTTNTSKEAKTHLPPPHNHHNIRGGGGPRSVGSPSHSRSPRRNDSTHGSLAHETAAKRRRKTSTASAPATVGSKQQQQQFQQHGSKPAAIAAAAAAAAGRTRRARPAVEQAHPRRTRPRRLATDRPLDMTSSSTGQSLAWYASAAPGTLLGRGARMANKRKNLEEVQQATTNTKPPKIAKKNHHHAPTKASRSSSKPGSGSSNSGVAEGGSGSGAGGSVKGKSSSHRRGRAEALLPCPKCNASDRSIRNGWSRDVSRGRGGKLPEGATPQGRVQRFRCRRCNLDYRAIAPPGAPPPPDGSPMTFSITLSQMMGKKKFSSLGPAAQKTTATKARSTATASRSNVEKSSRSASATPKSRQRILSSGKAHAKKSTNPKAKHAAHTAKHVKDPVGRSRASKSPRLSGVSERRSGKNAPRELARAREVASSTRKQQHGAKSKSQNHDRKERKKRVTLDKGKPKQPQKQKQQQQQQQQPNGKGTRRKQGQEKGWCCPVCTLVCREDTLFCEACGQKKPRRSRAVAFTRPQPSASPTILSSQEKQLKAIVEKKVEQKKGSSEPNGKAPPITKGVSYLLKKGKPNGTSKASAKRRTRSVIASLARPSRSRGSDPGYKSGQPVQVKWCSTWYNVFIDTPDPSRRGYYSAYVQNSRMDFHFSKIREVHGNFVEGSIAEREEPPPIITAHDLYLERKVRKAIAGSKRKSRGKKSEPEPEPEEEEEEEPAKSEEEADDPKGNGSPKDESIDDSEPKEQSKEHEEDDKKEQVREEDEKRQNNNPKEGGKDKDGDQDEAGAEDSHEPAEKEKTTKSDADDGSEAETKVKEGEIKEKEEKLKKSLENKSEPKEEVGKTDVEPRAPTDEAAAGES